MPETFSLPIAINIRKFLRRLSLISAGALYSLLPTVFNMVIAALVVRELNPDLWGAMVQVMLWIGITGNIMAWGNKDFLIRGFSKSPATLGSTWQQSFGSRSLIFLIAIVALFFIPILNPEKYWLGVYLLTRFIYPSYDSLVIYKRKFIFTIITESIAFIVICSAVVLTHPPELVTLLRWFVLAEIFKSLAVFIYFRKEVLPLFFKNFEDSYFMLAFPFFILYFSGMLSSKVDLICVAYFLPKEEIARYQVLMNFLLVIQSSAGFIILPFMKNIYRVKKEIVRKISSRLFLTGCIIALISVPLLQFILHVFYQFNLGIYTFLLGAFYFLPTFYYSPLIYRLFKLNKQNAVITGNFLIIATSLIANLILVPYYGINGALASVALAQWMILLFYTATENRLNEIPLEK